MLRNKRKNLMNIMILMHWFLIQKKRQKQKN